MAGTSWMGSKRVEGRRERRLERVHSSPSRAVRRMSPHARCRVLKLRAVSLLRLGSVRILPVSCPWRNEMVRVVLHRLALDVRGLKPDRALPTGGMAVAGRRVRVGRSYTHDDADPVPVQGLRGGEALGSTRTSSVRRVPSDGHALRRQC